MLMCPPGLNKIYFSAIGDHENHTSAHTLFETILGFIVSEILLQ